MPDTHFYRYDDYDPADAYYDSEEEMRWQEEQDRLEEIEASMPPEDYDETTLTDAQWAELDAKMQADEVDPPQPPAWMVEMWDQLIPVEG